MFLILRKGPNKDRLATVTAMMRMPLTAKYTKAKFQERSEAEL